MGNLIGWKVALVALVRFLLSVNEEVGLQMRNLAKWLVALRAFVPLNSTVDLHMIFKITDTWECLGTLVTRLLICHLLSFNWHVFFLDLSPDDWWKSMHQKIEIPLSTLPFTIKQMFKQKLTCCQYLYIHWSLHWSSTDITNIKITTTIILDPWSTTYWTPPPLLFWGWPLVRNQKQKIGLKSPSPMLWKIGCWSKYLGDTIQLVSSHVEAIYGTNIAW